METAVRVDHLPGAIIEMPVRNGAHDTRDIGRLTHSALRRETARNPVLINLFDFRDHVGADNAGLDFENLNPGGGEALRIYEARHALAGLRDAVFRPIYRRREGRNGRHE